MNTRNMQAFVKTIVNNKLNDLSNEKWKQEQKTKDEDKTYQKLLAEDKKLRTEQHKISTKINQKSKELNANLNKENDKKRQTIKDVEFEIMTTLLLDKKDTNLSKLIQKLKKL